MNRIKLKDNNSIPILCYGSSIIDNDWFTLIGNVKGFLKMILRFNNKSIKRGQGLIKILKHIKKGNDCFAVDTSRAYGYSEKIIGKIVNNNRDKFFLITKISNGDQYDGDVLKAVKNSLKNLNVESIDLLLMHWPVEGKYIDTWKQMIEIKKQGLCKSIGVCNCNIHHLEKIKNETGEIPVVNQFECHPLFTQEELREYCNKNKIQVMAYTSLARMDERLKKTCLVDISKKYKKSIAQVILKWHIQIGNIPVFNTSNLDTFKNNINIFNFELTEDEIKSISKININSRLRYDPDNCDFTKL